MKAAAYVKRIAFLFLRTVGVILALATFGLLAFHAWHFESAKPGTSAEYWEYLCGVQLPEFKGHETNSHFGGAYPVIDGKAYYYAQRHHDSLLFSVPLEDVLHDLPNVQEHLANPQPPQSSNCVGYRSLCELYKKSAERRSECAKYFGTAKVDAMDMPKLEALRITISKATTFPPYDEGGDAEFRGRLGRAQRAWATYAFEAFYLAAWLMFVAGLRPLRVRWYWRVASAPFLLCLPFFLGYAPMTFTFGPSGGFVYPIYLALASFPMKIVPCSALDSFVWQFFPSILSSLSQVPGRPAAATFMGCVGPVSSLGFGLLLLACISAVIYLGSSFKPPPQRTVR
jgi:hypothetical protein